MGIEIERKFLVEGDGWRAGATPVPLRQGYVASGGGLSVRVRMAGEVAFLTIKSERPGATRDEFEYAIPPADADDLLRLCGPLVVEKTRHEVVHAGRTWVVDVFHGRLDGLVLAEVELEAEDAPVELPPWAGPEVTDDRRYRNSALARAGGRPG